MNLRDASSMLGEKPSQTIPAAFASQPPPTEAGELVLDKELMALPSEKDTMHE